MRREEHLHVHRDLERPIKKGPAKSPMTSRWTSATTEVFEMYGPGRDGKEFRMMELTYTWK